MLRSTDHYVPRKAPTRHNSNVMSQYAVNAVTGENYPYKVGTYDTLRLFRVRDSTSTYTNDGKYIRSSNRTATHMRNPHYLYYDGPKEYMDHTGNTVDQHIIEKWNLLQQKLTNEKGEIVPGAYKEYLKSRTTY